MDNNKMIISYRKRWGHDGTCYRQTIKIDKKLMDQFNDYLKELKNNIEKEFSKNHCYSYIDLSIKSLELLNVGVNYTNLIHLSMFEGFLSKMNVYNKRITNNNTIFEVI